MLMLPILAGVAFFLILVLVAVLLFMKANKPEEPSNSPIIHGSGIYSIVRRSPRETIIEFKPTVEHIGQYLAGKNEDINGAALSRDDKKALIEHWKKQLELNIREVETGDSGGVEFYYYDFDEDDRVCMGMVNKGHFVKREEIFRFPQTIPPFHIGCRAALKAHHGSVNLRETTRLGMRPLFTDENLPALPPWSDILKLS